MLDPVFGYSITAGLALLFASAAAHKLRAPARFAEVLAAFRVLPEGIARRVAWLIPCMELCIAVALLWERTRRQAVLAAAAVLVLYALALTLNLRRGRLDLDCGCGTARDRRAIAGWMVWRNLFLAAGAAIAALPWSLRGYDATDVLTVGGGLIAGAVFYAAVDRLLGDVAPKGMILKSTS
jgi:Methylamine utilisation protein MauE